MNLAKKAAILSITKIAERTIEARLKVPDDFSFRAGQYIWLMVPNLKYPDVRGNTRMFSIASSPNRKGELSLIFRTGQSGYKKTLIDLTPGVEIIFSGPFGPLKLPQENFIPVVFLAGGVGVAPFLSMIRYSKETRSGHNITLIYANAGKEEAAYIEELLQTAKESPGFKLSCIFGPLKENQLAKPVNDYISQKAIWSVIGPKGFVDFAGKYLNKRGVPLKDIVFEQFYPDLLLKND